MVDVLTQVSEIQEFPAELVKALEGLNHVNRRRILISLLEGKQLSFSDIRQRTDMTDALLSSHLRKLKDSLLVEQYYQHIQDKQDYSYYQLTDYGKNILTKLLTQ